MSVLKPSAYWPIGTKSIVVDSNFGYVNLTLMRRGTGNSVSYGGSPPRPMDQVVENYKFTQDEAIELAIMLLEKARICDVR